MRAILFVVALSFCGYADSQPPDPSKRIDGQPQQNHSNQANNKTKAEERGTDNLPFVVKVIPSKTSENITNKNPQDSKETASDNRILEVTSAAITAIATAVMAFFTFTLARSTKKLWETTNKSVDLGRDEFISTHRPWITINEIRVREKVDSSSPSFNLAYDLRNIGHSPAFVLIRAEAIISKTEWPKWKDKQRDICAEEIGEIKNAIEERQWTVFPGDVPPFPYHDIAKQVAENGEYWPVLVGCIFYQSKVSQVIHKTPFVAWISKEPTKFPLDRGVHIKFSSEDGIIDKDQIVIKDLCITGAD